MNYKDFPKAAQHGDAWRYFVPVLREAEGVSDWGHTERLRLWTWFLAGWVQKGKQRVDVRCKTR